MEAAITQLEVNRRLAAILAADAAGYSRLMGEDEEATLRALSSQRAVLARCIDRHHGRVVSTAGDAVLADFASVVDAVACALTAQEELATAQADEAERRRLRFRIGVHLGDVLAGGGEVYGEGVNIASRLESIADPGGICVSATVYDLIRNKLPVAVEPLGEQRFENIAEPISAYRVRQLGAVPPAPSGEQLRPDKSIAVLPFENLSRDPEQNYFADGMTEEILTSLARLPELFVIARNSSFVYKNQPTDVREVSRQLGVKYILEGSVRRAGERVRISTQLVDGEAGVQMWAERYDGVLDDVFGLQDDVTQQIVSALELRLSREQRAGRLVETGTAQVQAYDYFLRGREQVLRYTQEANETARAMFEKAIEIDPSYAPAVVGVDVGSCEPPPIRQARERVGRGGPARYRPRDRLRERSPRAARSSRPPRRSLARSHRCRRRGARAPRDRESLCTAGRHRSCRSARTSPRRSPALRRARH